MTKIAVFIDGGHFFDGLHAQGFSTDLFHRRLMAILVDSTEQDIGEVYFYMARLPVGPYPNKSLAQQAYFDRLAKEDIVVVPGTTEVRGGIFIERDVEAALATELVKGAWSHRFNEALLVSRRSGFAPAVTAARQAGCTIRTAFFRYNIDPTDGLAQVAGLSKPIRARDIIRCTRSGTIPRGVHALSD